MTTDVDATTTDPRVLPAAGALALLVALVYVPAALTNQWAVDDARFILENPFVRAPEGWRGWLALLADPATVDPVSPGGIVRPLRTLEFALDHALFGLSPAAFHLRNVAWHVVATVLAFLLLRRLAGRTVPAVVGAAVWALHPMQVEAVAWVSSRGDVAMGACTFGALLLELRSNGRDRRLAAALAVGAIAMLYKETAIVLPLLVFAVRIARPRQGPPGAVAQAVRAAAPWVLLAGVYLAYRISVEVAGFSHARLFVLGGSTAGQLSTAFRSIGAYIVMALAPVRSDYDWYLNPSTSLLAPGALAWIAVLVALVVTAVRVRGSRPHVAVAICLFLFPLIPVANWPFQLGIPTTERFLYLSLLGLGLLVAHAAAHRSVLVAATLGALALGGITFQRTWDWFDDDTLLRSARHHETSPRAASWFAAKEREAAVEIDLQAVRATDPEEKERLAAEALARFERALELAHRSLELWHRFEKVPHSISEVVITPHVNAANSALFLGRFDEALWHSDRALAANDRLFMQPHYNRAMALIELGRPAEAVDSLERALALGARPDGHLVRRAERCGDACTEAGAFDTARRAYRIVGETRPEVASRGLARVDDALRLARTAPVAPQERAARLAGVGAPVPDGLLRTLREGALRDFVLGCVAERDGDDESAARLFERALTAGGLPEAARVRAERSAARLAAGCAAWYDQGAREHAQ